MARLAVVLIALVSSAAAAPYLLARQAITQLSAAQIAAFKPFSFYAAASYCPPARTLAWDCGSVYVESPDAAFIISIENCLANPTFKPIASGGDGDKIQFWYVGFDPTLKTLIVGHQGTDFDKVFATLTDANFPLKSLDAALFPGISDDVKAHSGFANEQAKCDRKLAALKTGISRFNATKVTVVGHSLGGALAELDSVFLPLHLPGVKIKTITYGKPRVGNQDFANLVSNGDFTHVNNQQDVVPILPGRFLGFHHPTGEIHIQDNLAWTSCPGQDNTNVLCTVGDVGNIFESEAGDHVARCVLDVDDHLLLDSTIPLLVGRRSTAGDAQFGDDASIFEARWLCVQMKQAQTFQVFRVLATFLHFHGHGGA
ncbi:Lipase [Mycena kentingensis (nom. inval.)]|nr:Lipase [Mycena kentingensis (nom. inval.)]